MMVPILFWFCVFALFHSYVLYPLILNRLSAAAEKRTVNHPGSGQLPNVAVILSVFNERAILEEKIRSVFSSSYPSSKIELIIGSDGSTDGSETILASLQKEFPTLRFAHFTQRIGKGNVLNSLAKMTQAELLVFTDAKVLFNPDTIPELIRPLADPSIGLSGGRLVNTRHLPDGISLQEERFMNREFIMKRQEGELWGTVAGVYGALYAIRRELLPVIPENFVVDDFFVTYSVIAMKYKVVMNPSATGILNVPNEIREEFRRKARISMGNFQNMVHFSRFLWPPWTGLSFSFLSHKILRWLGPLFISGALALNVFLVPVHTVYLITLLVQMLLLIIPGIDFVLRKFKIHILILRFISHFYGMNLALTAGFINYLKGIKSNVWEPTKR